jgi:hypothetical protein
MPDPSPFGLRPLVVDLDLDTLAAVEALVAVGREVNLDPADEDAVDLVAAWTAGIRAGIARKADRPSEDR